jgi:hypothetical protein
MFELRPVLVTTSNRGVFFGFATDTTGDTITLERCRNAIYWPSDTQGFLGLAAFGPRKGCRIGAAASKVELRGITSVSEVTDPKAVEAWESYPWSQ